jgi:hypothetical protein
MPESDLFPDVDPDDPIPDDARIIRYMNLQAFMTLLAGRVFIPSVKKLQETDPLESLLPSECIPDFPQQCLRLQKEENADWLDRPEKQLSQTSNQGGDMQRRFEVWLRELAVRRCIWCWYGDSEESMGLWNSYGPRGVAVVSSVGRIRKAFPSMGHVSKTSVGRVKYVRRRADNFDGTSNDPDWLYRPYYFKQKCYNYEREIRFVIGLYAGNTLELGGDLFVVDPNQLVEEIILSPQFRITEARALDSILREKFPWIRISLSPLLSVKELPEIRPTVAVYPNLISTNPIENALFGVV